MNLKRLHPLHDAQNSYPDWSRPDVVANANPTEPSAIVIEVLEDLLE
jgi:hypothetical protein